jgi:DNA-binding NarL/FixJ family response regulator
VAVSSVSVVDDHPIVRGALVDLLTQADFSVKSAVGSVEDPDLDLSADVIVCDLQLPGRAGARAVAHLVGRGGAVLACSGAAKRQVVLDSIAAGARGYVSKAEPAAVFVGAARSVASGDLFVSADVARYLSADVRARPLPEGDLGPFEMEVLRHFEQGDDVTDVAAELKISADRVRAILAKTWEVAALRRRQYMPTKSERAVMTLVAAGKSHAEIAAALFIATLTVPDHLKNIKAKYVVSHPDAAGDISPKAAAIAWATELGLTWNYGSMEFRWSQRHPEPHD